MPKKIVQTSKPKILAAAVELARERGLFRFSRIDIAKASKVGESTVSYHLGQMPDVRIAIVKHAVEREIISILADARASRESFGVVPMSAALKERVANYISR